MRELLTTKNHYGDMINDLTKELDKHLESKIGSFKSYIHEEIIDGFYLIRYPGATRGRIDIDENNIITEITLYESTFDCYLESAKSCTEKYVGMVFKIV